jgi:beta-D-xylosidase 4
MVVRLSCVPDRCVSDLFPTPMTRFICSRHHDSTHSIGDADVDCGDFVPKNAQSALNQGLITEADIDLRLSYLFRVRMRLGHFDPISPLQKIDKSAICSAHSIAVAREGPIQSSALLKNTGARLPLKADPTLKVAVIGPNMNLSVAIAPYYGSPSPCGGKFWNMVDAVAQYAPTVRTSPGLASVTSNDMSLIPAAEALAADADVVILVMGTDLTVAVEGQDAVDIAFNVGQEQLIARVASAAKRPVILVTMTAVPLDLTDALANPKVGAILHVGQPSVQTLGVGDLLFGHRVPAGRLVQTILPKAYQDQISIFDFNMRPGVSVWPQPNCTCDFFFVAFRLERMILYYS